ncbi:TPA: pyridoxal-phosphate dependent enzyme [Vibrio vulnificus]|nr:pyridoxal-phosphate dependent enzyme [Vibrio vulnificus]HAS8600273.1 pyridoxal-phosphate dependent enzyme [Vibrio vulnificus]
MFSSPEQVVNIPEFNFKLRIKRDDLLPYYLGGNKVRKNTFIINSLKKKPDVIITNGGSESNHARVCALMAAQSGIHCHLILHGSPVESAFLSGNEFFLDATKCTVEYVSAERISNRIDECQKYYESLGNIVCVIPGGGHSIEGATAYVDAVNELENIPDYIFLASGTGATHAGILAGVKSRGWSTKVVGISVARMLPRGAKAVYELYEPLCQSYGLVPSENDILFLDSYTFGGYGIYNKVLLDFIRNFIAFTGVPIDPTYTGKAMFALFDLIRNGTVSKNSNILFWHTGGLLNLQTSKDIYDQD